jgi:hypothetical protein
MDEISYYWGNRKSRNGGFFYIMASKIYPMNDINHLSMIMLLVGVILIFLNPLCYPIDPCEIIMKSDSVIGIVGNESLKSVFIRWEIRQKDNPARGACFTWDAYDERSRMEYYLGDHMRISGDDGESEWECKNHIMEIHADKESLEKRMIERLMENTDAICNDTLLNVVYEGLDKVDNNICYKLKISNKLNDLITINYYDTSNYYIIKSYTKEDVYSGTTIFSDFREIEGVIYPYDMYLRLFPMKVETYMYLQDITINFPLHDSIFAPSCIELSPEWIIKNGNSVKDKFKITYLDDTVFDYNIIGLEAPNGKYFVLLSRKDSLFNTELFSCSLDTLELGKSYEFEITKYTSNLELKTNLRGTASLFSEYYIKRDSSNDNGLLFWSDGEILIDVYYSTDIHDIYIIDD